MVKMFTKPNQPFTDAAGSQIGAATEHDPGGFTARMRVYDLNAHSLIIRDCLNRDGVQAAVCILALASEPRLKAAWPISRTEPASL
jgi:hypothetical protein